MHQQLKNILIANPFTTFFVDKRGEVFTCDTDRKRAAGFRENVLIEGIPESCREITMRRDGKVIRVGKARTEDMTALHQALTVDPGPAVMLKMKLTYAELHTRSSTVLKISRLAALKLTGQKLTLGEMVSVPRGQISAHIMKHVYGVDL